MQITLDCPHGDQIGIEKISVTYIQEPDTNADNNEYQAITIESANNGTGKDGFYLNIKTENYWSVDSPQAVKELLEDFEKRLYLESNGNK